jgi:hypothetical protein
LAAARTMTNSEIGGMAAIGHSSAAANGGRA